MEYLLDVHTHTIASGHAYNTIMEMAKAENTSAVLAAIRNPMVDIIGHPDEDIFSLEYEAVVEAAKETNTLLEVNNNSLNPMGSRKGARENLTTMLELCKQYEQPVILNSDAHVFSDVGRHDFSGKLIEELGFPEELIVNRSVEVFKEYINRKKKVDTDSVSEKA